MAGLPERDVRLAEAPLEEALLVESLFADDFFAVELFSEEVFVDFSSATLLFSAFSSAAEVEES